MGEQALDEKTLYVVFGETGLHAAPTSQPSLTAHPSMEKLLFHTRVGGGMAEGEEEQRKLTVTAM